MSRRGMKRTNSIKSSVISKISKRAKLTISTPQFPTAAQAGIVLVTGAGDVGQLGLGSYVLEKARFAVVKLNSEIIDVCAGGMHSVCLTKDGKVITFGCNDEGALGRSTIEEDAEFTPEEVTLPNRVVQISAGDSHTAALLEDGRVFTWGSFRDSHGNMGMTINGNEKVPYEILPSEKIVKIASGADHLVMLTVNGQIYSCGCAEQGQLGRTSERTSGRDSRNGIIRYLVPSLVNTKLSLKLQFDNIWAGNYCTFAKVSGKKEMYAFGLNNYNQLGFEKSLNTSFAPKLSKHFSTMNWKQVCCGQHHTVAITEEGQAFAIGRKEYGRLGLGDNCDDALEIKQIPVLKDKKCVHIGCGTASSFAVTDKGELYGWGLGTSGQLGTGEENDCFEPTLIKSKQLEQRLVLKVSSGGQHTMILAAAANNNVKNAD